VRVIVAGLGIQGRKRVAVAGDELVATVDPVAPDANHKTIENVPLETYDAALVCTPDEPKESLLSYLLGHGKHVLVEKPLLARRSDSLRDLARIAARNQAVCYTAYNHRFEPHLSSVKRLLDDGAIGTVYQARFCYGNGTARDVRNSVWRDSGLGVISDLASHLLDLVLYFFGEPLVGPQVWAHECFENKACDYFMVGFPGSQPMLELQGTLLSWRNSFTVDIVGEKGSIHVNGLCKWGAASLTVRRRVLPSGRRRGATVLQKDPT
jgi:predicted dehydrogenase